MLAPVSRAIWVPAAPRACLKRPLHGASPSAWPRSLAPGGVCAFTLALASTTPRVFALQLRPFHTPSLIPEGLRRRSLLGPASQRGCPSCWNLCAPSTADVYSPSQFTSGLCRLVSVCSCAGRGGQLAPAARTGREHPPWRKAALRSCLRGVCWRGAPAAVLPRAQGACGGQSGGPDSGPRPEAQAPSP